MSRMLNLFDHVIRLAQQRRQFGRTADAIQLLRRALKLAPLPAPTEAELHRLLGEIYLHQDRPSRARRHLLKAVALAPQSIEAHFQLACAIDRDPKADPHAAWKHFRKAVLACPRNPEYLREWGVHAHRMGKDRLARKALRRAVRLAPDDLKTLEVFADVFRAMHRVAEVRAVLLAARFRMPRDCQMQKLWNDFRFHQVRDQQRKLRQRPSLRIPPIEPTLLRFPVEARQTAAMTLTLRTGGVVRCDSASRTAAHVPLLQAWRPDPRRAP